MGKQAAAGIIRIRVAISLVSDPSTVRMHSADCLSPGSILKTMHDARTITPVETIT